MKRICSYRNCGCLIPEGVRSDSKYCNSKCRSNERTYVKRELKAIKKENELLLSAIKLMEDVELLSLYNKIYNS